MKDIIELAIEYVKDFFKDDHSGHDYYHTMRVYNLAKNIADFEKCDKEIVYLGALLHDVDDIKLVGEQAEKYINAKTFLQNNNYPKENIEKVIHIISQVSYKANGTMKPDNIEGMIVQDADRLDALGAIGISRAFEYGGNHNRPTYIPEIKPLENMSKDEYYKNLGTTINHFYEKLLKLKDLMNTDTAKRIAEHRHEYVVQFLDEFYNEWDGKC